MSSPTRSRDKVLQSLYEIEVGGSDLKEILKTRSKERKNIFFKNLLIGVTNLIDDLDATLKTGIDRSIKQLDPIERNILRIAIYELEKKELEYLNYLFGMGKLLRFKTNSGIITGIISGVDSSGQLIVESKGKTTAFQNKEIQNKEESNLV